MASGDFSANRRPAASSTSQTLAMPPRPSVPMMV